MKYYDGGITFILIGLFIGAVVAAVSIATNQGGAPIHSTYTGAEIGVH